LDYPSIKNKPSPEVSSGQTGNNGKLMFVEIRARHSYRVKRTNQKWFFSDIFSYCI